MKFTKRIKKIIISFSSLTLITSTFFISSCLKNTQEIKIDGYIKESKSLEFFKFDKSKNTITGYDKSLTTKRISIPEEIDGIKVFSIGQEAFQGIEVDELYIPSSVKKIHDRAFSNSKIGQFNVGSIEIQNLSDSAFENSEIDSFNGNIFSFKKENGEIRGLLFPSKNPDLKIPEKINGLLVREISNNAFDFEKINFKINSLSLPNGIQKIGEKAFYRQNISNLHITKNLLEVKKQAFSRNNIEKIEIWAENVKIGPTAFEQEKVIKDVSLNFEINDSKISRYLESAGLSQESIYSFNKKTGSILGLKTDLSSIYIPEKIDGVKVTSIAPLAFANKGIKKVVLSYNLEEIGEEAFKNNEISYLYIPKNIKHLAKDSFLNNKIKNIDFDPEIDLKTIDGFRNNKIYGTLSLPSSIKEIAKNSFSNNFISELNIPSNTKVIGENSFINNNIKEITIPKTVKEIRDGAFANNFMENLFFENQSEIVYLSGFNDNFLKNELDLSSLNKIEIIGIRAFESNSLFSLVLNNNLKEIKTRAFKGNNIVKIRDLSNKVKKDKDWR